MATDLSLPVNQDDILRLLVLGIAETPLDVHLSPLLVELLAGPGTGSPSSSSWSSRGSDIASAAPEIRRCQHHLHLAPLHLNCSTSSLASSVVGSRTPTDKWRNSDGGLESLLRFPTIPTTATARTRLTRKIFQTLRQLWLLGPPGRSCLLSPASCLLVISLN